MMFKCKRWDDPIQFNLISIQFAMIYSQEFSILISYTTKYKISKNQKLGNVSVVGRR